MAFENIPVKWENKGTEPSDDIKKNGFSAGYKPPAAYHNFLFANLSDCIKELQTYVEELKETVESKPHVAVVYR
ncbi:MAG: hypothetical protein Q4G33_04005, partial [bacterium]|nr:hypothetical protein [bacterium]